MDEDVKARNGKYQHLFEFIEPDKVRLRNDESKL